MSEVKVKVSPGEAFILKKVTLDGKDVTKQVEVVKTK